MNFRLATFICCWIQLIVLCAVCCAAVSSSSSSSSISSSTGRCDSHWSKHGDKCYKFFDVKDGFDAVDYSDAESLCDSLGSQLVKATDAQSVSVAQKLSASSTQRVWLKQDESAPVGKSCAVTAGSSSSSRSSSSAVAAADCHSPMSALCVKPVSDCAPGWYQNYNRCFLFTPERISWDEAKAKCDAMGADLLQVKEERTQLFLNRYLPAFVKQGITHLWIGMYQIQTGNNANLEWTSGGNYSDFYQNWLANEPNTVPNRRNAVRVVTSDPRGKWEVAGPTEMRGYACEIPAGTSPIVPTSNPQYSCQPPWKLFRGSCYLFDETIMSWELARGACKARSADLLDIRDSSEQEFVASNLQGWNVWMGLHAKPMRWGLWFWNDDTVSASYFYWADGEPNNHDLNEFCGMIWGNAGAKWNDEDCSRLHYFICKRPAEIGAPRTTPAPTPTTPNSIICDPGWYFDPFSNNCYNFIVEPMNWNNARLQCLSQKSDLASITSLTEKSFLAGKIQSVSEANDVLGFWIGFNDLAVPRKWVWSDASPVPFVNWDNGEPNNQNDNEDCGLIYPKSLFWNDASCSSQYGFICKKLANVAPTTKPPITTIPTPPGGIRGCPSGYASFANMCYRVFADEPLTWQAARQNCRNAGGELVSIGDKMEMQFVFELVQGVGDFSFWTGLHDTASALRTMYFQWSDSAPVTLTNWRAGRPNGFANSDDCVMVMNRAASGEWSDESCSRELAYVCKRREQLVLETPQPTGAPDGCPNGYQDAYNGYCFKYVVGEEPLSWNSAREKCRLNIGSNLVVIRNSNDQGHINLRLYQLQAAERFWIGLQRIGTSSLYWNSCCFLSATSYTNWQSGASTTLNYGYLNPNGTALGTWNMLSSTSVLKNYICQIRQRGPTTPVPPPTTYNPKFCASGWLEADDACYKAFYQSLGSQRRSWEGARHECRILGGDLASIHSINASAAIQSLVRSSSIPYWIGLNSRADPKLYYWSDGTSGNFFNWKRDEPNNFNSMLNCVQLDATDMKWSVSSCAAIAHYICVIPKGINPGVNVTTVEPPTTAPGPDNCLRGWTGFRDACYYTVAFSMDWHGAGTYCRRFNAELVSIRDEQELNFVVQMVSINPSTLTFWTGLNELGQTFGYKWSDNTPLGFTNWDQGQPNNAGGAQHCVGMSSRTGLWSDLQCGYRYRPVCKQTNESQSATPAPATPMPGECPTGYYTVGDKCFRLFLADLDKSTWTEASARCQNEVGGNRTYLASISNDYEQAVLAYLSRAADGQELWTGLRTVTSERLRTYLWADNSRYTFSNWQRGEPNGNSQNMEDCVVMSNGPYSAGLWKDIRCDTKRGFICSTFKQPNILTTWPGPRPTRVLCQAGWQQYGESCFKFMATATTWPRAQQWCRNAGADLASVHDFWEHNYMHSMTSGKTEYFTWLGMSNPTGNGSFVWSDGWPVLYTLWDRNYPSSILNRRCVHMGSRGRWRNSECDRELPYICRKSFGSPPSTPQTIDGVCPVQDAPTYGQHCYYFSNLLLTSQYKTFASAQLECKLMGGDLASVENSGEQDFLYREVDRRIRGYYRAGNVWLGMTRQVQAGFQWIDGKPVGFVHWEEGRPSEGSQSGNCVEMSHKSFKWSDIGCEISNAYVCKLKLIPRTATTPTTSTSQTTRANTSPAPTTTTTTTTQWVTTTDQTVTRRPQTENGGMRTDLLVVLIVSAIVLILLVAVVAVIFIRRRNAAKTVESGFVNANWSRGDNTVQLSAEAGEDAKHSSEDASDNNLYSNE